MHRREHDRQQEQSRPSWLTRRGFFGTAAGAAAGAYGLMLGVPAAVPRVWAAPDFKLRAPEPHAKHGGVLRYGILSAPAHFDVHQSGTISNMGTQGCMYDNLIRRNPVDSGQTIIPDLAHRWEIAPDGKTYTFFLRQGVHFHDGAPLSADDVKATYARIIWPPAGFSSPRTPLFSAVSAITVRDAHTIEFTLHEPRPQDFMLGAFASGWNIIVRKKTLEDHNYNLRHVMDYPGTGPFRHKKRIDKEVWVVERNPEYWNEGLPYLDGIEFYHLPPFSPEMGGALLSGKVDYARGLDPGTAKKVRATPGMATGQFYQSVIHAVWVNNQHKPFDDPRVRRALHLAFDKAVLVDLIQETAPMVLGGFLYPFSAFATPPDKLAERLGYQRDPTAAIKEARQLMAAAGYSNGLKSVDFMVREVAIFKLWADAIQAMLKETLKIETNRRTVQVSVWFDEAQAGNFDLTISAIVSTLLDPSDYFHSWYAHNGPQNYSHWHNAAFEALVPQIDGETDPMKRKALIRQAEAIVEQDPPLLPVAWEQVYDGWYTYVKGPDPARYFGVYDVVRGDTMWLDR